MFYGDDIIQNFVAAPFSSLTEDTTYNFLSSQRVLKMHVYITSTINCVIYAHYKAFNVSLVT